MSNEEEHRPGTYAYSPNQFTTLCEEVDSQGGAILPDRCEPTMLKYAKPQDDGLDVAMTCACGNNSMAAVPYTPSAKPDTTKELIERGAGFARICLICDGAGLWPRFEKSLEGVV